MKTKRLVTASVALVVIVTFGVLVANVIDYVTFHRAIARVTRLAPVDFVAIADFSKNTLKNQGFAQYMEEDIPSIFQQLKPRSVTTIRGLTDVSLYTLGEVYLELRIETSRSNQHIFYFTNSTGRQISKVLWHLKPEFVKSISPNGRLVTLQEWGLHYQRQWIVLPDRICVVGPTGELGSEDVLLASTPLDQAGLKKIEDALQAVPPALRGNIIRATNVADGVGLRIMFSADGVPKADDIALSNAWSAGVKPLLDAVSELGPQKYPVDFAQSVTRETTPTWQPEIVVRSLREDDAMASRRPKTPLWCLWRALQL